MTLRQARCLFTSLLPRLIDHARALGFECSAGEILRDPRVAELNARSGRGISNSLHLVGLAIDLNLYRNGEYRPDTDAHRALGMYWESLDPLARWGGRFGDGNHYSIEWEGRK